MGVLFKATQQVNKIPNLRLSFLGSLASLLGQG